MPHAWIGVDFGTSNSAVAIAEGTAPPRLLPFGSTHGDRPTFPSVLYFESRKPTSAGWAAIERYLATEHKGRFIQSLKAYLGDRSFEGTVVGTKYYALERLIAIIGKHIGDHVAQPAPRRIVLGRPVHFSLPADDELDQFAAGTIARGDAARGLRRDRVRIRTGGGGLRLRDAARRMTSAS